MMLAPKKARGTFTRLALLQRGALAFRRRSMPDRACTTESLVLKADLRRLGDLTQW